MKDNVEFNIKFIELIRERPCLYDYMRCDYSNKNAQDTAWMQISRKVNESVPDCKERWKNLRGCYTRFLKKSNNISGSSGKRVKPYYLSDHLSFLDSFTKTRETKEKIKMEGTQSDTDPEDSHESETLSPSHSAGDKKELYIENPENYASVTIKKPRQVYLSDINGSDMEYYPPAPEPQVAENQDPDFAFLYSVLPDMHEMSREQKRKFKMGVIKLAGDILQENGPTSSTSQN